MYTLAKELMHRGHRVGVFTTGGSWVEKFRRHGIRVYVATENHQLASLARVVRQHGYEVLHAHDTPSFQLVRRLHAARTKRVVLTVHGRYVSPSSLRLAAPMARYITVVSPSLQTYVRACGVPTGKVRLIENGIDTRLFRQKQHTSFRRRHGVPENAFVIGYAGRFTFDKLALSKKVSAVLRKYAAEHGGAYALIAGRGSLGAVPSSSRVKVLGHVPYMPSFYQSCDVVVGTARVALEALSCGVPTIAVGYSRYLGRISPSNFPRAVQTNFGDHAASPTPWLSSRLSLDIDTVRRNRLSHLLMARQLSHTVHRKYTSRRMAREMERLY